MVWNWESSTQTAKNVMHLNTLSGDPDDIFEALEAAIGNQMWATCSNEASVTSVDLSRVEPDALVHHYDVTDASWLPDSSGEFMPQVAALIQLRTNHGGRSGRGRVFLPFMREAAQDAGFLAGSLASTLTDEWQDFHDRLIAGGTVLNLAVASYVDEASYNVATCTGAATTATQRRRQARNRS
jgi:hypothetical protein